MGRLMGWLRSPHVSLAIDILVILSIALNVYGFYQSALIVGDLNHIESQLSLLNKSIEKNSGDIKAHISATETAGNADGQHTT
jgi:hypothetical protein